MSMVHEVAKWLEGRVPFLQLPESTPHDVLGNLYEDDLPDTPDTCVGLYEYGGPKPRQQLGNSNPTENPRLQVMVRSLSVVEAKELARQILRNLITINGEEISGVYYIKVSAVSNLSPLGVDSENRHRFSVNFDVEKEWSPSD